MLKYKIPQLKNSIFETKIEVRVSDINYGKHLGNDSFVTFLHEARIRLLKKYSLNEINPNGIGMLVTNLIINYKGQAFLSDLIKIKISATKASATSINLAYELINQNSDTEIARAINTITFYNYNLKKVIKIPSEFYKLLEDF